MRRDDSDKCPLAPVASNLLSPSSAIDCGGSILWCDLCGACGEWYQSVRERWLEEAGDEPLRFEDVIDGSHRLLLPVELYSDKCFRRIVEGLIDSLSPYLDLGLTVYDGLVTLIRSLETDGPSISFEQGSKILVLDRYSRMAVGRRAYTLSSIVERLMGRGRVFIKPRPLDLYIYRSAYPFYNREAEVFSSILSRGFLRSVRLWGPRIGLGLSPLSEEYMDLICPYLRVRTPSHKGVLSMADPMLYIALRRCVGGLPIFFLPYYVVLSLEEA